MKRDWIILCLLCLPLRAIAAENAAAGFGDFKFVSINGAEGKLAVSNETFHFGNSATNENGISFALQPFVASGQIIARIRRSENSPRKIGLVFRETTNATSRYAGMFLSGSNAIFERRLRTNEPPTKTVQTNANAEWLRVVREGNALSGFYSKDGTNWTQVSADTIEMPGEILAGFALSGVGEADFESVRMISAQLTNPSESTRFIVPTNTFLKADTRSFGCAPRRVEFFSDASKIGEATSVPFAISWSNALAGSHALVAKVTDNFGAEFFTAPVDCEIKLPPARARFVGVDDVTRGNWKAKYGAEGFLIVKHVTNFPAYAEVSSSGQRSIVLTYSGLPDALKLTNGTGGITAQWFTYTNMTVNISLLDGRTHRVAFYLHDSDSDLRVQQIEVIDAATQNVIDTRNVAKFHTGKYYLWEIRGAVRFQITQVAGNAVINGLFFDAQTDPLVEPE